MKTILTTALTLATTTAFAHTALAHEGPHMHPHGMETVWSYGLVALLAAAATFLAIRASR